MNPPAQLNLDPYYRLQPPQPHMRAVRCPRRPGLSFVNLATGQVVAGGCYSQKCFVCVQTIAWRYACAIGLARPEQHIVLTMAGEDWTKIKLNLTAFRRAIRRQHPGFRDAYHVEPNPRGTGTHVHMWSWGALLDTPAVSDVASRAGMGREALVSPRELAPGAPLSYGVKAVLDAAQTDGMDPAVEQFLLLNGGRLAHASRGFWRDADGSPIAGVRAAMKAANRSRGVWVATSEPIPPAT